MIIALFGRNITLGVHSIVSMAAVRTGDLVQFGHMLDQYGAQFQKECTYSLIIRLRHNVIKTGIRMISLSYSRWVGVA